MSPLTYADYAALPDDGRRYELIRGELVMTPAPGVVHQRVVLRLLDVLNHYVRENSLGEVFMSPIDVILSDDSTLQPDIGFVAADRSDRVRNRGIVGAPTLVVEVLSPSNTPIEIERKADLNFEHGVPHFWIVDPQARTIRGHVPGATRYVMRDAFEGPAIATLPPFPRLAIPLAEIWSEELPD